MMKPCIKCGGKIPARIKVDGKERHLCSRKLCLKCSPWGLHNTKKDPSKPNKKNGPYANWSPEQRQNNINLQRKYRKQRSDKLLEIKGGKCETCGYNTCKRALVYHHIDPKKKRFGLTVANLTRYTWEEVLKEADNCKLLCANCHAEEHDRLHKERILPVGFEPTTEPL